MSGLGLGPGGVLLVCCLWGVLLLASVAALVWGPGGAFLVHLFLWGALVWTCAGGGVVRRSWLVPGGSCCATVGDFLCWVVAAAASGSRLRCREGPGSWFGGERLLGRACFLALGAAGPGGEFSFCWVP